MRRFTYDFQCRGSTLIICAVILTFGFLVFSGVLTRKQPPIPDTGNGVDSLSVYRPTDDTDTTYYTLDGRVICAPRSTQNGSGGALEGMYSLDIGTRG